MRATAQQNRLRPARGGYSYQARVGVLRLLDLIDPRSEVASVTFENPAKTDSGDFFDDIKIELKDGSLHWFQVKWGFQQSIDSRQPDFSLGDFCTGSGDLFIRKLYDCWTGYGKSKKKTFCHIYTSKVFSHDLGSVLKNAKSIFSDGGQTKKFKVSILPQLRTRCGYRPNVRSFNIFLNHLILSFNQPGMYVSPELKGPIVDLILQRILDLGLTGTVFTRDIKLSAKAISDSLYKMACDASLNSKRIELHDLIKRLQIDPEGGRITQPELVLGRELVFQESLRKDVEKAIETTSKRLVFLVGRPGSGKSWFLESWHRRLRKSGQKVPIFYCSRGLDDRERNRRILESQIVRNLIFDIDRDFPELHIGKPYEVSVAGLESRLNAISSELADSRRQLFIVDGLDHVERIKEEGIDVREKTVIDLLHKLNLRKNIVFIIGTQPGRYLNSLFRKATTIETRGFTLEETNTYLTGKHKRRLNNKQAKSIYQATDGLPLILSILAREIENQGIQEKQLEGYIAQLPQTNGEIEKYYTHLWNHLPGAIHARTETAAQRILKTLCLKKEDLTLDQKRLRSIVPISHVNTNDLRISLSQLRPLLDHRPLSLGQFALCHPSLKEFLTTRFESDKEKSGYTQFYYDFLRKKRSEALGHRFYYDYAYDLGEFDEILESVDLGYIDRSATRLFPARDILGNIDLAIRSAYRRKSMPSLVELGLLKFYTEARFRNIDEEELAKTLISLGITDQIRSRIFHDGRLCTSVNGALSILLECKRQGIEIPYSDWFRRIWNLIADLDEQSKSNISFETFVKCVVQFDDPIVYHENVIAINTRRSSEAGRSQYCGPFIQALEEAGKVSHIVKLLTDPNFQGRKSTLDVALIKALCREGNEGEAKRLWAKEAAKRLPSSDDFLLLGCRIGAHCSAVERITDPRSAMMEPPGSTYLNSYAQKIVESQRAVTALSYCKNRKEITNIRSLVDSFPRSYVKEYLRTALVVYDALGASLRGDDVNLPPDLIERLLRYQDQGGEEPRAFDVWTSDSFGELLCELITQYHDLLSQNKRRLFIGQLPALYDARKLYSVAGSTSSFPSTSALLEAFIVTLEASVGENLDHWIEKQIEVLEKKVRAEEQYEGERTTSLLQISRMWAVAGAREKAMSLLRQAIKDAHSYGYHKDITLNLLVDSLHFVNEAEQRGILKRISEVAELTRYIGALTDWRDVREAIYDLIKELATRDLVATIKLLNHFRETGSLLYYEKSVYALVNSAPQHYLLRYFLSETIVEVENLHNELNRLLLSKIRIIKEAWESGENKKAPELLARLRMFLLRDVAESIRPELVTDFNELGREIGDETIDLVPTTRDQGSHYLPDKLELDGRGVNFEDIITRISRSSLTALIGIWETVESTGKYYIREHIQKRISTLIDEAESKAELETVEKAIGGRWDDGYASEAIWKLAQRYRSIDEDKKFLDYGLLACEKDIDWGGVFHRRNVERLIDIARAHEREVQEFLLEKLYKASIAGSPSGWAVPIINQVNLALGNERRVVMLYEVFWKFVRSLFRHMPKQPKKYGFLARKSHGDSGELLFQTIVYRLLCPELEVKHRTTKVLCELVLRDQHYLKPLFKTMKSQENSTALLSILSIIHFMSIVSPQSVKRYAHEIKEMYRTTEHWHIQKSAGEILHLLRETPPALNILRAGRILLPGPSDDFVRLVLRPAGSFYKNVISEIGLIGGCGERELLAEVEKECMNMGIDYDNVQETLEDQSLSYQHASFGAVPFESVSSYYLGHALYRLVHRLGRTLPAQVFSDVWEVMRMYDPLLPTRTIALKPADVGDIPTRDSIDEWLLSNNQMSKEEDVSGFKDKEITLGEIENISNEEVEFHRTLTPVFVSRQKSLQELKKEDLVRFLRCTARRNILLTDMRTLSGLRPTITHGAPLLCYHAGFWYLQGGYQYMRLHPKVVEDLQLQWSDNGLGQMRRNGDVAVRFIEWRNGYLSMPYSRTEEHYGCRLTVKGHILKETMEKYGLNVAVVERQMRKRKREKVRGGRPEEVRETTQFTLLFTGT